MKIKLSTVLFLSLCFFHNNKLLSSLTGDSEKIKDKIQSCILWSAIGDALGRVTEFKNIEQIYKKYQNGVRSFDDFKDSDFYIRNGKKTALYTDDTQMSMLVLENCLNLKKESLYLNKAMEDLADRFIKWVNDPDGGNLDDKNGLSYLRAPGKTCIKSCDALGSRKYWRNYFYIKRKYSKDQISGFAGFLDRMSCVDPEITKFVLSDNWWNCGTGYKGDVENEGGSGAVMRAWPFGLCFYNDPELAAKLAAEHSKLTHRNSISLAACAAIAAGVAYAIQKEIPEFITKKMIEVAKKYDQKTSEMMQQAVKYSKDKTILPEKVLNEFRGWAAHEAIAATIYIFNKTPDDVQKAVEMAVNTPGDSDTIATLVGALVGTYSGGFNKINSSWLELLEDSDKLISLSDKAFSIYINNTKKRKKIMAQAKKGDTVKVHYTGKLDDESVFDSSKDREPLQFKIGEGKLIAGFEDAVIDLEVGRSTTAKIPFDKAYGPKRPEMVFDVKRREFPENVEPKLGMMFEMTQKENGQKFAVAVIKIVEDTITLDANHPLAGKDLIFEITLEEIV